MLKQSVANIAFFVSILCIPVYVSGQWMQLGLDLSNDVEQDMFGRTVSISENGNRIAVGAPYHDGNMENTGEVSIYYLQAGNWFPIGNKISGSQEDVQAGYLVSLSGDGKTVAIGLPGKGFVPESGHVQVFKEENGNWNQYGEDIIGKEARERSGQLVSISADGQRIAIGGVDELHGDELSGLVRVYEYQDGAWNLIGNTLKSEDDDDFFAHSIALSSDGKRLVVGTPENQHNAESGYFEVYEEQGGSWERIGDRVYGMYQFERFGWSVDLSSDGQRVAASTYSDDGRVRVFEEQNQQWNQMGPAIEGPADQIGFGSHLSISSNGEHLIVGAPVDPTNGDSSGLVQVYRETDSEWTALGTAILGEGSNELFGFATDISSDGYRIIAGSPGNPQNSTFTGIAEVYEYDPVHSQTPHSEDLIILSPNPTNGTARVQLDKIYSQLEIIVRTSNGRTIDQYRCTHCKDIEIQIEGIPGLYLLDIIADDNRLEGLKLIKE